MIKRRKQREKGRENSPSASRQRGLDHDLKSGLELGLSLFQNRRHEEAARCFAELLRKAPANPDVLNLYGLVLAQLGDSAQAVRLLQRAVEIAPHIAMYHYNLGTVLNSTQRFDQAENAFKRVIAIQPNLAEAYNNLGNALAAQERFHEAFASFGKAVELRPNYAEAWSNLGYAKINQGEIQDGIADVRKALALAPDYFPALLNLGIGELMAGAYSEAVAALETAVAKAPAHSQFAKLNLAKALYLSGDSHKAGELLQALLAATPGYTDARLTWGDLLMREHRYPEAIREFTQVLESAPDSTTPHLYLARAHAVQGEFEQAARHYETALRNNPDLAFARFGLSGLGDRGAQDESIREIAELLDKPGIDTEMRIPLHYALGRLLDRAGQYEQAFTHYRQANRLKGERFDRDMFHAYIDRNIAFFDADFFSRRSDWGSTSAQPIFILGLPRSGTTLTEQILSSHPDVHGAGELTDITRLARSLGLNEYQPADFERQILALEPMDSLRMSEAYITTVRQRCGCGESFITDKMPGNFLYLGMIAMLFPAARIVHCRRNPADNCLSLYFQDFRDPHPYAYDLDDLASYYRGYHRLMRHWRTVLPDRIVELDYDRLVNDQENVTRRLLADLHLNWNDQCLRPHENKRIVDTASIWQARQPVYRSSSERWKHYAAFLPESWSVLNTSD